MRLRRFADAGIAGAGRAPAPNPLASVVFLGDSLTAGFQNGSLLDAQQVHGFASLLATQAQFPITLPLIGAPGMPAALTLVSDGLLPVLGHQSGVSAGRENPDAQPTDLAVPGYTVGQLLHTAPTATPSPGEDLWTELVLGYPEGDTKTQPEAAVALAPTAIFLWIGGNDALPADAAGSPQAMTPLAGFTSDYTLLMTWLKAHTSAHLVVANVADVTAIAYMTPASEVLEAVAAQTGIRAAEVGSELGIAPGDLVNPAGLAIVEGQLASFAPGGTLLPLPGSGVLTSAEIVTVQATIAAYNQVIAQQVAAVGGTLVDLHACVATLAEGLSINGFQATTAFLGGLFSLDGVHPTDTGYALIANCYIATLNSALDLSIPAVNVAQVAANDPYFGGNLTAAGAMGAGAKAARMALLAAQRPSLLMDAAPGERSRSPR